MRIILLTRGYEAVVDDDDYDYLSAYRWHALTDGRYTKVYAAFGNEEILMHRVILSAPEGMGVDHVDGDGLNNRKGNLRLATKSQNAAWSGIYSNNTSGYRGVTKYRDKWMGQIIVRGKKRYLGLFERPENAALAYDVVAELEFGEFAFQNFGYGGKAV